MAIGSNPEVGSTFKSCRDYTMADWEAWWQYMRDNWGEYLQAGYATLVHDKTNNPIYNKEARDAQRRDRQARREDNRGEHS